MELILAFLLANMIMRAKGATAAFAPGAGPVAGAGPVSSWARRGLQDGVARPAGGDRPIRPGRAGLIDRWANWRDRAIQRARRGAERQYDRIEHDRRNRDRLLGTDDDPRSRWERLRDQRRTCPDCGHGGLVGYRHDCRCTSCRCQHQHAPHWGPNGRPTEPVPPSTGSPVGGDGPAASTDPTSPTPTTPGPTEGPDTSTTKERTDPVTVTPTSPTAPSSPSAPVSPGASRPAGPASGGGATSLGNLPALDQSDVRIYEARLHLNAYAANATLISEGLRSGEVDQATTGKIADLAAQMNALVAEMHRVYGPVEQAINDSRHVARTRTYQHR